MEEPQDSILLVCVAKGTKVLAQYVDRQHQDLGPAVALSLSLLPALHRAVTFTVNERMACYLIYPTLTYCAVVRESFGKEQGFGFLESVQEAFRRLLMVRGFHDNWPGLEELPLERDFVPLIENLLHASGSFCSQSWQSDQSFDDSVPLVRHYKPRLDRRLSSSCLPLARSKSGKKTSSGDREMREVTVVCISDGETTSSSCTEVSPGGGSRSAGKVNKSPWWCSLKFILAADLILCILIACGWLAICRGFSCR